MLGLPDELSGLANLKELLANNNQFEECPVSILSSLTALNTVDLSHQHSLRTFTEMRIFEVPSLLPMLHPGLVKLDLRQHLVEWTPESLHHLENAAAASAAMKPPATLTYQYVQGRDPRPDIFVPFFFGMSTYNLPF